MTQKEDARDENSDDFGSVSSLLSHSTLATRPARVNPEVRHSLSSEAVHLVSGTIDKQEHVKYPLT